MVLDNRMSLDWCWEFCRCSRALSKGARLTIVGGVRDAWSVWRRERLGTGAPAAPFRPLRARAMSFVRLECGLAPRPAPQLHR